MAADWIKMRSDLYRDPKVCVIADILRESDGELARYVNQNCQRDMCVTRNVMRNVTVGALVSVWGVMRTRGKPENTDLVCSGMTISVLDDIADLPGFGAAMGQVGWVVETEQGIVFPHFFEDHNVDPEESKKKKNAERQARFREKSNAKVTVTSNVTSNVTVTPREEKRREDINTPPNPLAGGLEKFPDCPFKTIVDLYHEKLPELPAVRVLDSEKRIRGCRKFWQWVMTSKKSDGTPRAQTTDQALTWIAAYFERAKVNDFLMGRTQRGEAHQGWQCDFDFLLTDRGRKQVIEKTREAA